MEEAALAYSDLLEGKDKPVVGSTCKYGRKTTTDWKRVELKWNGSVMLLPPPHQSRFLFFGHSILLHILAVSISLSRITPPDHPSCSCPVVCNPVPVSPP